MGDSRKGVLVPSQIQAGGISFKPVILERSVLNTKDMFELLRAGKRKITEYPRRERDRLEVWKVIHEYLNGVRYATIIAIIGPQDKSSEARISLCDGVCTRSSS